MHTVIGRFRSAEEAEGALTELRRLGFDLARSGLRRTLEADWRGLRRGLGASGPYGEEHEPVVAADHPLREEEATVLVTVGLEGEDSGTVERVLRRHGASSVEVAEATDPEVRER